MTSAIVPCAACSQPITRVRNGLAWGHMQRQPVGTLHYARPVRPSEQDRSQSAVPLTAATRGPASSAVRRSPGDRGT